METRANYVVVGAFMLVLLIAIMAAILWLARPEFNREATFYDILFAGSVTGLSQGSPVRYNGIPLGRVVDIRLDPTNLERVRVTIRVETGTVIKADAVASLESQGITGLSFVEITGGSQSAPPLERKGDERYPVIVSQPSGFQRLATSAPEVLSRLIDVADRLALVLDDKNRVAIADSLQNMRRLTATAANRSADIDTAIADSAAAVHDLRAAVNSANQAMASLHQVLAPTGEVHTALATLTDTTRKLGEVATHIDALVQENRPPLHDFSQRGLSDFRQLIADTRTLVASLNRVSDQLERDPSRFLFGNGRREGYQPR